MGKMELGLFISLVILLSLQLRICDAATNTSLGCIQKERTALLNFKATLFHRFSNNNRLLLSWNSNNRDCCAWESVTCHKSTGHVINLDLTLGNIADVDTPYGDRLVAERVDSSLLELKHLTYLDLSFIDFNYSKFPAHLGSLKQLQYLNLSYTHFSGVVPQNLGNLSSLRTLDLSGGDYLEVDDLMWASRLSSLEHLYLSYVNLSMATHVFQHLSNLSSLRTLDLRWGSLGDLKVDDLKWVTRLSSLEHLDLSGVDLSTTTHVFEVLNTLPSLLFLGLGCSDLDNMATHVFQHLSNLSSLRTLDLSGGSLGDLKVDDLMWLTRLSLLEHLDLTRVNLSRTTHVFEVLNTLPSLLFLSLADSDLDNTHLPVSSINDSTFLANLQYLDLSGNSFQGEFPCFLPNMTSLTFLDLSWNMLNLSSGSTHLPGLKKLTHLNLVSINILMDGKVDWPSELLRDRVHLKSLHLDGNGINGDILGVFKNFSSHKIESLSLRYNNFYGELPQDLGELNYLMDLDLSHNLLHGRIPTSLGNLTSLRMLDLYDNRLSGEIPISLGELSHLESFDISLNCFETTYSEAHFSKLSKLEEFRADNNKIRFDVGYDWVPPFQLIVLSLRSSTMGGRFPEWLQTQKALKLLDLSNCSITGSFPAWLRSMNSLRELDLSRNNISGPIPELSSSMVVLQFSDNMITHLPSNIGHMMPFLVYLNLARNMINGSLPDSLCRMEGLSFLDLSKNSFSGNLPNCWPSSLAVASLSYNELTGVIPKSIGGASSLLSLHLNANTLSGHLPSTLKNCTGLKFLDVGGNNLSGKLPQWIGKEVLQLRYLRLRKNDFSGTVPHELCHLSQLRVMDLANNNLTGNIPHCFANFSGMMINHKDGDTIVDYGDNKLSSDLDSLSLVMKGVELEYTTNYEYLVNLDLSRNHLVGQIPWELTNLSGLLGLNLSHNHLEGEISAKIGDLKSLESLDLSNNHLVGEIPQSLSNLYFLSRLNLSNNNLSGHIPSGRQLQTLDDPSIYQGNPLLCGPPLQRKCDESPHVLRHEEEDEDEEDRADKIWFYGIIIAGFATGFWVVIGVMVVKTKWRHVYFRYIEVAVAKMLSY